MKLLYSLQRTENSTEFFITYYNNENLYEKVWRHGVYHTGDTAYKDENGYFWYVAEPMTLSKQEASE